MGMNSEVIGGSVSQLGYSGVLGNELRTYQEVYPHPFRPRGLRPAVQAGARPILPWSPSAARVWLPASASGLHSRGARCLLGD